MGGTLSAVARWWSPPPPPPLVTALQAFWARKEQHPRALYFKALLVVIEHWLTTYSLEQSADGKSASITLPKAEFQGAFPNAFQGPNHFDVGHVNQGLLGVAEAEGIGKGHGLKAYKMTFNLELLNLLSVPKAPATYPNYVAQLCHEAQAYFRSFWQPRGTIPAKGCPMDFDHAVEIPITDGESVDRLHRLRDGFQGLSEKDVGVAQRCAHVTFVYPDKADAMELDEEAGDPWSLASSFFATIMNHVIMMVGRHRDGSGRACASTLTEHTCQPYYWAFIKDLKEPTLRSQVAHLLTVPNVLQLLQDEIVARKEELAALNGHSVAVANRIAKLEFFITVVEDGGVSQHMAEFGEVACEANSARWAQAKNGKQPGAPELLSAARVKTIPLSNARKGELRNFLVAFGFPVTVQGVFRKATVLEKDAFFGTKVYKVEDLSKDVRGEIGTRVLLAKTKQQVKVQVKDESEGSDEDQGRGRSKVKGKGRSASKGRGSGAAKGKGERGGAKGRGSQTKAKAAPTPKRFFYQRLVHLIYSYEAPVAPRVAECLGEGKGNVVAEDPGGRCFTEVTMEYTGKDESGADKYKFKAAEYFKKLPEKILTRTAKSGGKLSRSQLSRNARNRDQKVRDGYEKLEVGSSRVDLQACKLEYSIVSPK